MKLSQMEYFLAVAEELNFTAAAKNLYISQPALSRQIVAMEEELGVQLLQRSSRKVSLTPAGVQLRDDIRQLLAQLESIKERVAEIGRNGSVNLRIGCFDGATADDFLPGALERLRAHSPQLQIKLMKNLAKENRKALKQGTVDLIFELDLDSRFDEDYVVWPMVRRDGAVVYSEAFPLAKKDRIREEDFSGLEFLSLKKSLNPELYQNGLERLEQMGIKDPRVIEVENYATLSTYLELGQGYTILAAAAAERGRNLRKFVPEGGLPPVWVIAVWKKGHPLAAVFEECLGSFAEGREKAGEASRTQTG